MAEYQLYCFAQSGNAYRCALMLNLIGADWKPIWVDFFAKGEQRTPEYRTNINEMGEAPVLVHGDKKLSQSGVILTYLADRSGKFRPDGEDERLEALRWIIFDNQKVNGFLGPYRFLRFLSKPGGVPRCWRFSRDASTTTSPLSTSDCRPAHSCWAHGPPSPISRWWLISITRRRSSASISRPSTSTSRCGSIASRRCRAGNIRTI
jgi:glutathione S-transferase